METIEWLLNALTKNLSCTCEKSVYECACRNGDSKVVGLLLDKYFELSKPPFDSVQVWKWVENLHYDGANSASRDSKAVLTLQQDAELRQGILKHVFSGLTDREHIFKLRAHKFGGHSYSHSGLNFRIDDIKFIVDLAFKQGNPDLWACFIEGHSVYRNKEDQGPHELRRYMRGLALEKPLFMRAWVKFNRASKKQFRLDYKMWHLKSRRREKRWGIAEDSQRIVNQRYVQDNREIVESGRDWGCLRHFSDLILHAPEEIENEYGDIELVKSAVRNCLDFIAPDIPDLIKLAELRCSSKYMDEETVLHAACLEIWRTQACLENIDTVFLMSLRTRLDTSCKGMTDIEQVELKAEIDRLIFSNAITPEKFLRQYLEPQLADSGVKHPQISLLISDEAFNHLRGKLSLEWLGIFLDMDVYPLSQLFEIAAQYADHEALKLLIQERCSTLMSSDYSLLGNENIDEIRMFWLMRGWYFFDTPKSQYWVYLKNSDKTMYELCERSGRLSRDDHRYWPKLTASKVESILDTFVEKFPKVDLPSSWGTSSPKEEKGYRFLTDVIWLLDSVESESAIPVIVRLIADQRFVEFHNSLKSMYASQIRKKASVGFLPPNPNEIVNLLDHNNIATVEGLRSLIIQELVQYQADIDGGEFNPAERFYDGEARKGEVKSTEVIAERLQLRLQSKEIVITSEHQVKNENRVDFTATKMISGRRRLLVTEVKGQWHKELYTAAAEQLYDRYSIHPDAEQQGVFLVIWFGKSEKVAGRTNHGIKSALDLKASIEKEIPPELLGRIDVFVLDVSRW
jgi:hypothetical protein